MNIFVKLWQKVHPPKPQGPQGPCQYCGKLTDDENIFIKNLFSHQECREVAWKQYEAKRKEREAIELFKIAIREVEEEKRIKTNEH